MLATKENNTNYNFLIPISDGLNL